MKKVGVILVPYISSGRHLELAIETISSLRSKNNEIFFYLIVNKVRWQEDIDTLTECCLKVSSNVRVITNDENCLAKAWNIGIKECFNDNCDYAFLPNLDLIFQPECLDNLVDGAKNNPNAIFWCADEVRQKEEIFTIIPQRAYSTRLSGSSFSYFMISPRTVEMVGYFDEQFKPAYFEDNDYCRRIELAGGEFRTVHDALVYHYGSQTLANDNQLQLMNHEWFRKNREYYINKWNGLPGQEKFLTPFGR